jgi:hypothetical protein
MVKLFDRDLNFNLLNIGFVIGIVSCFLIFYVESSLGRNFLGLLTGIGFSPVFTTERINSIRYYLLSAVFISFIFILLAGFRWPLIIAFFVLVVSAHGEFESKALLEKIRSEE